MQQRQWDIWIPMYTGSKETVSVFLPIGTSGSRACSISAALILCCCLETWSRGGSQSSVSLALGLSWLLCFRTWPSCSQGHLGYCSEECKMLAKEREFLVIFFCLLLSCGVFNLPFLLSFAHVCLYLLPVAKWCHVKPGNPPLQSLSSAAQEGWGMN